VDFRILISHIFLIVPRGLPKRLRFIRYQLDSFYESTYVTLFFYITPGLQNNQSILSYSKYILNLCNILEFPVTLPL